MTKIYHLAISLGDMDAYWPTKDKEMREALLYPTGHLFSTLAKAKETAETAFLAFVDDFEQEPRAYSWSQDNLGNWSLTDPELVVDVEVGEPELGFYALICERDLDPEGCSF